VCASMSSGLYRCSVCPFLTNCFFAGPPSCGLIRYALSDDWKPTVGGTDRLFGDAALRCMSHSDACSTDPSEARSASSNVVSSNEECREANKANLKSVDSSSCSFAFSWYGAGTCADALSCCSSIRFRLRDTNASILRESKVSGKHVGLRRGKCYD
jgi:hypothetical protein